jgi:hypothetical protein
MGSSQGFLAVKTIIMQLDQPVNIKSQKRWMALWLGTWHIIAAVKQLKIYMLRVSKRTLFYRSQLHLQWPAPTNPQCARTIAYSPNVLLPIRKAYASAVWLLID